MHQDSIFLTLTYDDAHVGDNKLDYSDFQKFMKSLREWRTREILTKEVRDEMYMPYMCTGEYGDKGKRKHWHAIIFNFRPEDAKSHYTTDRGDRVFRSDSIDRLWKKGFTEFGSVTIDSAGYVARYAAKKLVHGMDGEHDYEPIHRTSSRRAIGRSWIEKHWEHTFLNGFIVLPNGSRSKIPRYYVDWAKDHRPEIYEHYVTEVRPRIMLEAEEKERREWEEFVKNNGLYVGGRGYPSARKSVKLRCLEARFKNLQENLKL